MSNSILSRCSFVAISVPMIFAMATTTARADLIVNGSFESPIVPVGGFTNFVGGSTAITGWTVVGIESSIVNGSINVAGIILQAQDGDQWIDLAGQNSNSPSNGVRQFIPTVIGQCYELNFYVGSATGGGFVFPSTVDLSIDGGSRVSYFNPTGPSNMFDWKQFTVQFMATTTTTNITFFNGSAANNFLCALDNVSLVATVVLGDVNGDCMVSLLDVAPFVELITTGGFLVEADINGDGAVNLQDVSPFVDLLTN